MSVQSDALFVEEDGSIELGDSVEGLCFHQALNVFLVTTRDGRVRVYDPHSSLKLSDVQLQGKNLVCVYHGESNSVVVCGGRTVGMRRDHHGVLLLDTVLQAPVAAPEETVTVEMLLSEGIQLQQTLGAGDLSNIDHAAEVREVLSMGIAAHHAQSRINPKLAKWSTLRLELPLGVLRSVCLGLISELKRLTRYIPALSTASALNHRLAHLLPPPTPDTGQGPPGSGPPDRDAMFSEASRLATFIKWPHMNYKWALPEQMAQAGFYHQPIATDDDRAMCFICSVCLVYWEPTDEPWSEHERHSPNCPFVKGEYTHNVPLSVTYATSPALTHSERAEEVAFISNTNSHQFIASATRHGSIVVWNTAKELKKEVSFSIDPSDSTILDKHFSDTIGYTDVPLQPPAPREAWPWGEEEQNGPANIENDPPSHPGSHPETDAQGSLAVENDDAANLQSPLSPSPPSQAPPAPPAPPPPPAPPSSQVVDLPLDDIAVDELFAPPRPSHDVRVSSLCVLADPNEVSQRYKGAAVNLSSSVRSCLVVGVGLRRYELFGTSSSDRQETCDVGLVQVLNNVNQASQRKAETLDIMKLDSSRIGSVTEEENDNDCIAVESESASLSDPAVVSTSVSAGQQNFVPYLLVYDLNVMVPQTATSNKVAAKPVIQGPYKKSTVKVGTFGQSNISYSKSKQLWSDPLANDIEMFFAPPNVFVKNKGTSQVSSTSTSKSKAKDSQVPAEPESKNDLKKEPKCIQCIPLPHKLNSVKLRLTVDHIVPTTCGEHIIVTLSRSDNSGTSASSGSMTASDSNDGAVGGSREVFGAVIIYKVCRGGDVVTLQEEPINTKLLTSLETVPKKLLVLPPEYGDNESSLSGMAACITVDGSLRLLSLSNLEFLHHLAPPPGQPYNNAVYCNSLERLCVSCDDGRVNLVQLRRGTELGKETDSTSSASALASSTPSNNAPALTREPELMPGELLVNQGISEEVLDKCVELIQFQTGCPRFVATVPPCWSEIIQAQKQRRNPQHLQQHAEDMDTTRTWRLESDSSTWDEHLFELLLPAGAGGTGGVQVGHIDLKLNFIPGPPNPLPVLQVTLLRQNLTTPRRQNAQQGSTSSNATSSGSPSQTQASSSSNIPDDVLEDYPENPVLTKEFQFTHNAEILCGPVTVNRCMDLSGQGANVTLTSPSLLACRTRTYLVHIKALPPKLQQQQQQQQQDLQKNSDLDLVTQYMPPQSSTFLDRLAASSNKRVELVRGCDIIQELSITVRCCAKTTILHDRLQRLSIVENEAFHKNLIEAVISDNSSDHVRHRALDLLLWITSIHTAAIDDRTVSVGIITLLQLHLSGLVRSCVLLADRSIAHKTAKIIVTALEGSRVVEGGSVFGWAVLEALLEWLDHILQCQSAGALHWFFTLLNHVKWCNPWGTARKVTQLLSTVSEAVSGKVDPLHAVLQTKFNLYGTPFERELFDIEPPLLAKQTINGNNVGHSGPSHSTSNNNNNNNNNISFGSSSLQGGPGGSVPSSSYTTCKNHGPGTTGGYPYSVMGRDDSDIGGLLGRGGAQGSASLGLTHTSALCGLLEVEPLHFTLHMASDGTKMERASSGHPGSPFMMQPFTIPGGLDTSALSQVEASTSSGTAKAVDVSVTMLHKAVEDMAVKNQALELRLAKKATKTYLEKLQTLSDQLASMKHCLQKAKQRTQTLAKVVAAENSQAVDPLLPLDVEGKANDAKEEASTISSRSSDTTPDHDGVSSCLLPECDDVMDSTAVQYIGNGHVGSDVSGKIDFGLTSLEKDEDDSKPSSQQGSNTKRKSEEDVSSLESKSSTPSAAHPQAKESTNTGKKIPSAVQGSLGAPWQQLLSLPPQQMLVIERMHSGARRFVVLDFGAPVLLTDVVIPACGDLVSLSIDIWMTGEEMDGERLVVASDIGMRPLILADLQPPPLCRYLKVTTLGRYGMNTSSQCRIPVGAFYGHTLILPWQLQGSLPPPGIVNKLSAQTQLTVLSSVVEDIGCRYSLACSKLRSLLNPLLMSPTAPTGPNSSSGLSEPPSIGSRDADLERKITQAYQECMLEQQHLNLVVSVMRRLQRVGGSGEGIAGQFSPTSSASRDSKQQFVTAANCASDKLATLMQYLLNCLLTLSLPIPSMSVPHNLMEWCGPEQARVLVEQVCVRGPKGAQVGVASLLARLCAGQPWWGDFLASTMITLFSSSNTLHFPATRVFALLTFLGQKSVGSGRGSQVIDAVLRVLSAQLHSSVSQVQYGPVPVSAAGLDNIWQPWQVASSQVDTHLISWLLLYLSLCLDALTPTRKSDSDKGKENGFHFVAGGRWTWLTAETCLQRRGSEASRSAPRASRDRLRKRLVYHQKQQLVNLETATKSLGEVTAGQVLAGLSGEIYQKLDTIRRSIVRRYSRTTSASSSGGGGARKDDGEPPQDAFMPLDRANALSVAHGLIKLLMNSSSPCCVDSFLLTCKVIGGLVSVTRPSPALTEIVTRTQLGALLRHALTLDTTWGAPWALHALTCLLQDILEGERLYGSVVMNTEQHREEVENFDIAMDGARAAAAAAAAIPSTSGTTSAAAAAVAGPSGAAAGQSGSSGPAGPAGNGVAPTVNGSAAGEGGTGSPQSSASPLGGACVVTQNCQADQSATPLSPPVVGMATAHYTTLEEEDIPGKYSFLDLEDSSESEDMIGEYLADMPAFVGGASNNSITSFELAVSNLPPPYPPPLPTQSSSRSGKDSRIGDLVAGPLASSHPGMDHSTAVDARLEAGVSLLSELRLHMMAAVHTSRLSLAVTAPLKVNNGMWGDTEVCGPGDLTGSVELLTDVFQKILLHLSMQFDGSHVESVLGLWLSINLELAGGKYAPSVAPTVHLTPRAISALLAAVVRSGSVSMRCWCLVLQTLTLCCNYTPQEPTAPHPTSADQYDHVDLTGMSMNIVTDTNFVPALQKLLTGSCATGSDMRSDVVGSTVTGLLEDLLVRLRVRCDVISVTSGPGTTLKHALLSLVARLLEPQGAISLAMGPLDAQCCLLGTLLSMHYDGLDRMHVPLTIISSTVILVHGHLVSSEGMTYGANNQNATMLGGLFASVLGSDGRQGPAPSRLALLCSLLNLSRKLAQTPLVNPAQVRVGVANYEAQENSGGSLTDSSKLEQQRTDASSSQTDEHKAMHTPQTCSHAAPNSVPCLADTVLQNGETMQLLLKSVAACEGSSVSMLLGTVSGEVSEKLCLGETLTDALYQLLLTLNAKATAPDLILRPVVEFITPGGWWSPPSLSEPALCFFTRVLDCPAILEKFAALGGMKMLWENLVSSVGMMGGGRGGLVTAVMNHLAPPLPPSTHNTPSNKRNETVEQNQGLYNFAPLAVVTSSNPTARPANVLVDSNQLFQRTKSAPWSYHFYPDESWVDLNLTLPCAVLLHEVHLLPHTVSLVSCPSAVSVEVGVEGGYLMPVSGPLSTAGLSRVRLVLPRPVVASIVVVRLHRPRDSSTLGLSQLKLLGTTTFREASRGVHETAISDHTPHRASMWWLRLIHQCMCRVEGGLSVGVEAGASVSGVMEACVTLLLTPPGPLHLAPLGSAPLEATTLALAALSPQLLHTLIMTLLTHPLLRQPAGGNSLDAAIALLYELCVGNSSMEGVTVLISWLNHIVLHPATPSPATDDYHSLGTSQQQQQQRSPQELCVNGGVSAEVLHCIAAVLWNTPHDTTSLITDELFRRVYEWSERVEGEVKIGLDHIMCSMCHVRPQLFTQLLLNMAVLTVIDNNQSITDDRKDREAEIRAARTDDMKEGVEGSSGAVEGRLILQDPSVISLTPAHLQTLATVAQSPQAIHLMLDSGFPLLLVHGILEWCKTEVLHQVESCTSSSAGESATDLEKASVAEKSRNAEDTLSSATPQAPPQIRAAIVPTLSTSLVAHTLHTLAALCAEPPMKDWLGSAEGSVFWLPLLTVLGDPLVRGSEPLMRGSGPSGGSDSDYSSVEDATIHLMRQCCHNHPHNQNLLASTLCHLIQRQNIPPPGGVSYLHSLSGFTRRLVLQLLLETERVVVHINSPQGGLSSPTGCSLPLLTQHPKFGAGHKTRLLNLPTTTTMSDIVKMVTDWSRGVLSNSGDLELGSSGDRRDANEVGHLELVDKLSVAAGVTAKDKREKNKVNSSIHSRMSKRATEQDSQSSKPVTATSSASSYVLVHESLGSSSGLPSTLTVAQVMAALRHEGHPPSSHITLTLTNRRDHAREGESGREALLLCTEPLPSTLHVFTSQGGLSLLAQHMSLLYPDTGQQQPNNTASVRSGNGDKGEIVVENDWVSVEMNDYESANVFDYLVMGGGSGGSPGPMGGGTVSLLTLPSIPPHALGAFTLFLRLPGYAETLLKDTHKACCLLRLALGVTDDGDGGDIVGSGVGGSLATMPFQVLESLLEATPLTTDDGLLLRRMCLESGALHLILACLAALSHQDTPEVVSSLYHQNVPIGLVVATTRATCVDSRETIGMHRGEGDRCHYWAKGTGFGTGSTTQSWDVEQALVRQKVEEEHVVWLVRLLAQYINPGDILPPELQQQSNGGTAGGGAAESQSDSTPLLPPLSPPSHAPPPLPPALLHLFQNSGLITTIASNLSNDSVLDMSRHVPLYRALLALVRGLSVTPGLAPLLLTPQNSAPTNGGGGDTTTLPCVPALLEKMKTTVNTYMAKLRWKSSKAGGNSNGNGGNGNNNGGNNNNSGSLTDDAEQEEGLSLIVPDIQNTAMVVKVCTDRLQQELDREDQPDGGAAAQPVSSQSLMEVYLAGLKPLQFDTYEMLVEDSERGIRFVVPHHYEGSVRGAGDLCTSRRMKRLAQEAVTLSTSLPLSYSSSVFVRTDLDRLDIMKVLITGPEDTPYANGCFEFDVYFPVDYPTSPLHINLQTTGEGRVRFNPNLYQDGKVCLSILNTWHGRPEEKWNPQTSSLLQVLVSIQSLIFVSEPYFNEPGYERSRGTPAAMQNSREYDANIRAATVRWAMLNQLRNPSPCFKEVIERHFWLKHKEILEQIEAWIADMETLSENRRAGKNIAHNTVGLKKNFQLLKEEFRKMSPPPGLEGVPLTPSLVNSCSRSPAQQPRDANTPEKEREGAQGETEKEMRGAAGGQAGGPVRTRIRKTSRANLFMGKPQSDKHSGHSSGIPVSKVGSTSSSSTAVSSTTVKSLQYGASDQEVAEGGLALLSLGEQQPVSLMPELVQATKTTTCQSADSSKIDGEVDEVEDEVCNHVNHSSSSVKNATPESPSSHNTSAGMPC